MRIRIATPRGTGRGSSQDLAVPKTGQFYFCSSVAPRCISLVSQPNGSTYLSVSRPWGCWGLSSIFQSFRGWGNGSSSPLGQAKANRRKDSFGVPLTSSCPHPHFDVRLIIPHHLIRPFFSSQLNFLAFSRWTFPNYYHILGNETKANLFSYYFY